MQPARRTQNLPELFFAALNKKIAALRAEGADVISLDAGSPDLPPTPALIETLKASANDPTKHSYGGYAGQPHLRQAIATYYGRRFGVELDDTELLPLIGSKEGLVNLHLAWLDPGDLSLIPDPGYTSYTYAPLLAGGRPERFDLLPERGWLPDFSTIPAASAKAARMLWLNYPNNPTGAVASLDFLAEAVDFCRRYDILLCYDNPYADVTYDGYVAPSVLQIPGAKEVALEFNSLSKTYNMAGWRVGMAVGNRVAVKALAQVKTQIDSGIGKPIQDMAAAALSGDQSWLAGRNAIYQERRDLTLAALRRLGFQADTPKAGLYVWFRLPTGTTSLEFQTRLLEEAHISLTPGSIYGRNGEGWLRISLAVETGRLKEALSRLERVVGGKYMPGIINFYHLEDEYGCFSNFARYPIKLKGKTWPTSEHYFQAQKFAGTDHEEAIRLAETPMIAAQMGRDRTKPLRSDWEAIKDEVMREAVMAKFRQHPELREILLGTGQRLLIEHTGNDSYWGDGGDGRGKNRLGRILMEVREKLAVEDLVRP